MSCEACRRELMPRLNGMKEKAFEAGKSNERFRIARMLRKMPPDRVLKILEETINDEKKHHG